VVKFALNSPTPTNKSLRNRESSQNSREQSRNKVGEDGRGRIDGQIGSEGRERKDDVKTFTSYYTDYNR
jgi:hypothetical protein